MNPRYRDGFLAAVRPARGDAPVPPRAPENLPPEERIKRDLHPLDSFPRLLDCVAHDRPPAPDDAFRFRWFGLFYQGPREDAFVLRLRSPGRCLVAAQLAALADITQEFAGGHVVLNAQGGLDIPGVPVRAAAEILSRTESIGLCARQSGGDCVQSVRGGDEDALVGVLEHTLLHRRDLANLPRGCEIIFQRADEPVGTNGDGEVDAIVLQAVFAPAPGPDDDAGTGQGSAFLLVVPGDLEGGFLLPSNRVVPNCLKLLETWAADADRTDRRRAGLAAFCGALGRARIGTLLGNTPWQPRQSPGSGGGDRTPGFAIPDGRLLSGQLSSIGGVVREHGLEGVRLMNGHLHVTRAVGDATRAALAAALIFAW